MRIKRDEILLISVSFLQSPTPSGRAGFLAIARIFPARGLVVDALEGMLTTDGR